MEEAVVAAQIVVVTSQPGKRLVGIPKKSSRSLIPHKVTQWWDLFKINYMHVGACTHLIGFSPLNKPLKRSKSRIPGVFSGLLATNTYCYEHAINRLILFLLFSLNRLRGT